MKRHTICYFTCLLLIFGCSDPEKEIILEMPEEEFFIEITIKNSTHRVSYPGYQLNNEEYTIVCADKGYVYGYKSPELFDGRDTSFIQDIELFFSKKIYKDQINLNNDLSYIDQVANSNTFGFPIKQRGFYEVHDLETGQVEVSRNSSGEVYLNLTTTESFYRSTSVVPNMRDSSSFVNVSGIITNEGPTANEFPYFLEGTFRVNLFKGMYGTISEQVDGKFRWPLGLIRTSDLVKRCK
jgi:hypothetical protein